MSTFRDAAAIDCGQPNLDLVVLFEANLLLPSKGGWLRVVYTDTGTKEA